jgi:hypothetical protein
MKLSETIELMNSTDYKDRFKAEYYQLTNRRNGLKNMLVNYADETLKFTPSCSYDLLHSQLVYMDGYIDVLQQRALRENIDLDD